MECDGAPLRWLYGPLFTKPIGGKNENVMRKNLMRYAAILVFFVAGTISIIKIGANLHSDQAASGEVKPPSSPASNILPEKAGVSASGGVGRELRINLRHPVSVLLLQVIVVLTAARIVGA